MPSIRTENARALFIEFRNASITSGIEAFGISRAFADRVEVSPQVWSNIRSGRRAIGDALARRMECRLDKPEGWLDQAHTQLPEVRDAESVAFIDVARQAYCAADDETRRLLVDLLEGIIREGARRWDHAVVAAALARSRLADSPDAVAPELAGSAD